MAVPRFGQFMPQQPSILEGIKTASNIAQAQSSLELRKKQEEREAGLTPFRRQLLEAQAKKIRQQAEHPEMDLTGLPEIARQRAHVAALKKAYGEDSIQAREAQGDLNNKERELKSQIAYREALAKTLPIRTLTPISKAMTEKRNIKAGLTPAGEPIPGKPVKLEEPVSKDTPIGVTTPRVEGVVSGTPELEDKLAKMTPKDLEKAQNAPFGSEDSALLDLYISKQAGLGDNIKQLPYASLIETTLASMKPDEGSVAYYSGVAGKARYARDVEESQRTGKLPPQLAAYTRFSEKAASTLVPQITKYYGTSITEGTQRLIRAVTNPATWQNSPERALVALDSLVDILEDEIQTRRDLVTKPSFLTKKHAKAVPLSKKIEQTGLSLNELVKMSEESGKAVPLVKFIDEIIRLQEGAKSGK